MIVRTHASGNANQFQSTDPNTCDHANHDRGIYGEDAIGKSVGERRIRGSSGAKTLYWSSVDPGSFNVSESSAKSGLFSY